MTMVIVRVDIRPTRNVSASPKSMIDDIEVGLVNTPTFHLTTKQRAGLSLSPSPNSHSAPPPPHQKHVPRSPCAQYPPSCPSADSATSCHPNGSSPLLACCSLLAPVVRHGRRKIWSRDPAALVPRSRGGRCRAQWRKRAGRDGAGWGGRSR